MREEAAKKAEKDSHLYLDIVSEHGLVEAPKGKLKTSSGESKLVFSAFPDVMIAQGLLALSGRPYRLRKDEGPELVNMMKSSTGIGGGASLVYRNERSTGVEAMEATLARVWPTSWEGATLRGYEGSQLSQSKVLDAAIEGTLRLGVAYTLFGDSWLWTGVVRPKLGKKTAARAKIWHQVQASVTGRWSSGEDKGRSQVYDDCKSLIHALSQGIASSVSSHATKGWVLGRGPRPSGSDIRLWGYLSAIYYSNVPSPLRPVVRDDPVLKEYLQRVSSWVENTVEVEYGTAPAPAEQDEDAAEAENKKDK